MPKFNRHIFVCCNQRPDGHPRGCCDANGSAELRSQFKVEVARRGLTPLVRANSSGCLDQCELGPTVVIYPEQIWYGNVKAEDVARIVEQTVIGGEVLEDLLIPDERLNTKGGRVSYPPSSASADEKNE